MIKTQSKYITIPAAVGLGCCVSHCLKSTCCVQVLFWILTLGPFSFDFKNLSKDQIKS